MTLTPDAPRSLGGYLALELGTRTHEPMPGAIAVQSARAAFRLVLRSVRPRRVWLPWYLCDSMVDEAVAEGVDVVRFGITEQFGVPRDVAPARDDLLLCVNYFGLCDTAVDEAIARVGADRVVVDNSHAYFSAPRDAVATIYSPRKFVGVPDGGFLVTGMAIAPPDHEDSGSLGRIRPLVARHANGPEATYAEHVENERGLAGQDPARMSRLTRRLLASVDFADVARRRQENHDRLHQRLGGANASPLARSAGAVPLAYPFFADDALRLHLRERRIYTPRFWPHLAQADVPAFERHLYDACIPLPCSQDCSPADLERIVDAVQRRPPT